MPDTIRSVAVLAIALLPGALFVWAFERQVGNWGVRLSDRALRFVGGSAVFHAGAAPLTYWLWTDQWQRARAGEPLEWWLWPFVLAYVGVPIAAGLGLGIGVVRQWGWVDRFSGSRPPRAWDHLFSRQVDGWVRLRLKSGTWLGGAFAAANGRRSWAAGYPEPEDLYLAGRVDVDPDTGEFVVRDDGTFRVREEGILVRWDEVEYLEFIDA